MIMLSGAVYLYMQQPQFGKAPTGARLQRIQQSPNYKNGQFQNQSHTPAFTDGANFFTVMGKFLFDKNKNSQPPNQSPPDPATPKSPHPPTKPLPFLQKKCQPKAPLMR